MQVTFQTENLDRSRVALTINVDKSEVEREYSTLLKDAQKNIAIKGFRKGKVPMSVLEMKFKDDFLNEAAGKLIDEAFKSIVDKLDEKPLSYAMPKLDNFVKPEKGSDYSFKLIYETYPKIKFGNYKGVEVEQNTVVITDEDIEKEIDRRLEELATIEVKDGAVASGDIVQVNYEVKEGDKIVRPADIEYIHIGKDYDQYKIGVNLIKGKKGETISFEKDFTDSDVELLKGKKFQINATINEIKTNKKPKLTDKIAKQLDKECEGVEDLKSKTKKNQEEYVVNYQKNQTVNSIVDKIVESFEGDIPDSMIDEQVNLFYNDLLSRVGGVEKRVEQLLKMEGLTIESYKLKMRDKAIDEVKRALILRDVAKLENIQVTDDEVKTHIEPYVKYYKMEPEQFLKIVSSNGQMDVFKNEVEVKKAIDFLYENAKIKKAKKIKFEEIVQ